MAVTSKANAVWTGSLTEGSGQAKLSSGSEHSFTWKARAEQGGSTTPEELIAGAHAACYSMALSNELHDAGFASESVAVSAEVDFDISKGGITQIRLSVEAKVPEIGQAKFEEIAGAAKEGCPVSKALAGTEIVLASATLA